MKKLTLLNEILLGLRGLLTLLVTWAGLFIDAYLLNLTGFSPEALKIAFLATAPITLKLIWTDLRPRLKRWLRRL